MINVNDNEVNESLKQSEVSDEDAEQSSDAVEASQNDQLSSEPTKTDKPAESGQDSGESMESVMNLYEESFKRFAEGEVVTGRIISVDKDHVLIDIGYKSEGQIRIQEFKDDNGNVDAEVGDTVEVMVEWWDYFRLGGTRDVVIGGI